MWRWRWVCALAMMIVGLAPLAASAQTTTYHLHDESSGDFCCRALKTNGPDAAAVVLQSVDLKNHGQGNETLRLFQTIDGGVGSGIIPAGSSVSFTLWMKKTSNWGVIYPRASLGLNGTTSMCSQTGGAAISTSLTQPLTFSCEIGSDVAKAAADKLRLAVGYYIETVPGNHSVKVELYIEGTLNGNYDSRIVVPDPVLPSITNLNPTSGTPGTGVTITGTNFGASQGTSAVKFDGTPATTVTNWSDTSITATVPTSAASGPVTVTVGGVASNGVNFAVGPSISSLSASSAAIGETVTVSGANFGATQGASSLTFNGVVAAPTQWSATSITARVPAGATTGPVLVTVGSLSSAGASLTVLQPTITSLSVTSGIAGDPVTITGAHFLTTQLSNSGVTFNGVPATISSWSDTSIATTIPAGAATGPVVVTVFGQPSNGESVTVYTTGGVAGTITKSADASALQGATVQAVLTGAIQGSATTGPDGTYSISNLPPGAYDIRVQATSYSTEVRSGTVVNVNTTTAVNVAMSQPGSISGRVTQPDGLTPIAGAAVTAYAGPIQQGSTNTNGTGDYTINSLHPGGYTVQAASAGYRTSEQGATVGENATTTQNFSLEPAPAGPVQYAYDELGRLVQVTDPSGDAAIYRYDAVGNILAIERPGVSTVAISAFTPSGGTTDTSVTIYGAGFSTTPAQNTVTFNGVAAAVTSATATQIVTAVPSGASTGNIAVTTPTGSATSTTPFTVLASDGPPTISGFSPTTAASGTVLTVNGSNFETVAGSNNLRLNISPAQVSSATATALQSTVPASATTGRVSVATPVGSAASADYLWIAPPPYAAADVLSTTALAFGTATPVPAVTANKIALLAFEGTEGRRASVSITGNSGGTSSVAVYDPFGKVLRSKPVLTGEFLEPVNLRATATYSIVFDPLTTNTTTATLTVHDVRADFTGSIVPGGDPVPVTTDDPGQNGWLTFGATAGQRIALGQDGHNCFTSTTTIQKPDGTPLVSNCGGSFIDVQELSAPGQYRILVDPKGAALGTTTLTLYSVPPDASGSVTINGSGFTLNMNAVAQNGLVTFSGTQGQQARVRISGNNVTGFLDVSLVQLLPGGGEAVLTSIVGLTAQFDLATQTLPATGDYKVVVSPMGTATGSATVSVLNP